MAIVIKGIKDEHGDRDKFYADKNELIGALAGLSMTMSNIACQYEKALKAKEARGAGFDLAQAKKLVDKAYILVNGGNPK